MKNIEYIKGDATRPSREGNKVIVHICNDLGAWGKGFVLALSARWKLPERKYKEWAKSKVDYELGQIQSVKVESDLWVINLIGQEGIRPSKDGTPPIRYDAVELGIHKVAQFAVENNASVHMPRIGCGLAGGTRDEIEPILHNELSALGIDVTVYDFE